MCAPVGIIQACVRVHQYTVTCASSFVQEAALTALSDCAEDVEAMRKEYQRRKDYVVKALKEKGWDIDTTATTVEEAKEAILLAIKKREKIC